MVFESHDHEHTSNCAVCFAAGPHKRTEIKGTYVPLCPRCREALRHIGLLTGLVTHGEKGYAPMRQ